MRLSARLLAIGAIAGLGQAVASAPALREIREDDYPPPTPYGAGRRERNGLSPAQKLMQRKQQERARRR